MIKFYIFLQTLKLLNMKLKFILIFSVSLILISCGKKEKVEIGEITERSAEEQQEQTIKSGMAPEFAFNSIDGKKVSLEDLRGKIIYADIWATWCRPCLMQIPALKEVEERYKDNSNIQFVSISIDNEAQYDRWQSMVKEKQMGGLHLFAGRDQKFQHDYQINSIPRFLLIGKEGELINDNAPRPLNHMTNGVNEELITTLDQLLKE